MQGTKADRTQPQIVLDLLGQLPGVNVSSRTIAECVWGASSTGGPWEDAGPRVKKVVNRIAGVAGDTVASDIDHHYVARGRGPIEADDRTASVLLHGAWRNMQLLLPGTFIATPQTWDASVLLEAVTLGWPIADGDTPVGFVVAAQDEADFDHVRFVETASQVFQASGLGVPGWPVRCVYVPRAGLSWYGPATDFDFERPDYMILRSMKHARLRWVDEGRPRTVVEDPQPVQLTLSGDFIGCPNEARSARLDEIVLRSSGGEVVVGYIEEGVDFAAAVVGAYLLFGGEKLDVYRSGRRVELGWVPEQCVRDHTLLGENAAAHGRAYAQAIADRGAPPRLTISEFSQAMGKAAARTKSIHIGRQRLDVELQTLHDEDEHVVSRRKKPLAVLERLATNANEWVSAREIVKSVWGVNMDVVYGPDGGFRTVNASRRLEQAVHELRSLLAVGEPDSRSPARRKVIDNTPRRDEYSPGAYKLALDDVFQVSAAERGSPLAAEVLNGEMGERTVCGNGSCMIALDRGFTTAAEQPGRQVTIVGEVKDDQPHLHVCIAAWQSYGNIRRLMRDVEKEDEVVYLRLVPERDLRSSYGEWLILHEIVALAAAKGEDESWASTVGFCGEAYADSPGVLWDALLGPAFGWYRGDVVLGVPAMTEANGETKMELQFASDWIDGTVFRSGRKLRMMVFDVTGD